MLSGAFYFLGNFEKIIPDVVAVGAGGFLYIALVDLFAELKVGKKWSIKFGEILSLILGFVVIYFSAG